MITKKELAARLAQRSIFNKAESFMAITKIFELMGEFLEDGEDINIGNFGRFFLYEHSARPVRNPKTQEDMILKPFKSPKFKASETLKKRVKKATEPNEPEPKK